MEQGEGGRSGVEAPDGRATWTRAAAAAVAGVALLALQAWRSRDFLADDALISLRYAQRLLAGDGLTFTDGEWVEGYSNLLLVLLSAALGAVGVDLIVAVRVVGSVAAAAAVFAIGWWGARRDLGAGLTGATLFGGSAAIGIWAMGGLEQALLVGLLSGALTLALAADADADADLRRWSAAGGLLALACLTRPDAPMFVALASAWALWRGWRAALVVCAPGVVAVLGQLAFRLAYYGDWVPNTAHVKLTFTPERLMGGLAYLADGWITAAVFLPIALLGAARAPNRVRALLLPVAFAWLAYVAFVGGDIFPARRHLVPAMVPLALLATYAWGRRSAWVGVALAFGAAALHGLVQDQDDTYRHTRVVRWEWRCGELASAVGRAFREEQPLIAVNAAGCWPYFSGLPALDMLGLNDRHIALHPTPGRGRGHLGHDLGDGEYVLSRAPDLLTFGPWHGMRKPGYLGERTLIELDGFKRNYRLVRFEDQPTGTSAIVWVKTDSPRIGPKRLPDGSIAVGAHLIADWERTHTALIAADGTLTARLAPGVFTEPRIPIPAGTWRVVVDADGAPRVTVHGATEDAPDVVHLPAGGRVRVRLDADRVVIVRGMRFVPYPAAEGPP